MNIFFISNACSDRKLSQINKIKTKQLLNPSQKYFSLLVQGITKSEDCSHIFQIAPLPVAPSNCKKKVFRGEQEQISETHTIYYPGFLNVKLLKNLIVMVASFVKCWKAMRRSTHEDTVMIYDPLIYDASIGALLAAKFFKKNAVAVLTDVPKYMAEIQKTETTRVTRLTRTMKSLIIDKLLEGSSGYVFLTESMNDLYNKFNKPYVIIEGIVDVKSKERMLDWPEPNKKIVLYAGGLHRKFGVGTLIDAMRLIGDNSIELHLYGEGEYIEKMAESNNLPVNVKYMGMVDAHTIFMKEKQADLLVNPRPVSEVFTEYSFPSKTVEYMSSGTPVLTTQLKGIPKEYFSHLYVMKSENARGMADSITEVLNLPREEIDEKGQAARNFVLTQKNNVAQSEKMMDLIRKLTTGN